MLECINCWKYIPIDPVNLLSGEGRKDEMNLQEETACPICDQGHMCFVDDGDEKFWGCGICGNVWYTKPE